MALTTCRECKEPVDASALTCPHCGARVPRRWEMPLTALVVLAAVGGVAWYLSVTGLKALPPAAAPSAEQIEAERQQRSELGQDLLRVCEHRRTMRSTQTFRLVKVVRETNGNLCVHYTVANAMGSAQGERVTLPAGQGAAQKTHSCDNLAGLELTALFVRSLDSCPK